LRLSDFALTARIQSSGDRNIDQRVVDGFGEEWSRFDQADVDEKELRRGFDEYFAIFPWDRLPADAVGFDVGCGSGRWARFVAPRVGRLHCIDASRAALDVARRNLAAFHNCVFSQASVDQLPLADGSAQFGYSLGVLHHVPDTAAGIRACARKLEKGAPLLLYLYYRFDNRPRWYAGIWRISEMPRRFISRLSARPRAAVCAVIALVVYWPLARLSRLVDAVGAPGDRLPLHFYSRRSLYTMRTDALDRFGTALEQRFTRREIEQMMRDAGLRDIVFSERPPYWCAVGIRE
jgi:SAM-dependent methyltransferase